MYRGNSWDIMWDYNGTWYIYHGIIYVYIYIYIYVHHLSHGECAAKDSCFLGRGSGGGGLFAGRFRVAGL